jgi:hypothetical protein
MTPIAYSINIQRPIHQVFDFVSNFENDKYWWKSVIKTQKLTPGPVGVGTESDQVAKLLFVTVHNRLCVTEYHPPDLIACRNESPQLAYDLQYHFTEEGNTTKFTLMADLEPKGVLKWLLPITMRVLYRQLHMYFQELKTYLEAH